MFCSNCGTQLEEGARFCPNCGTPVVKSVPLQEQENNGDTILQQALETGNEAPEIADLSEDNSNMQTEPIVEENTLLSEDIMVHNEAFSALESTIPDVISVNGLLQDTDTSNDAKVTQTLDVGVETVEVASNDTLFKAPEMAPVQIPAAFQSQTGQPSYVQESANVLPPDYAKPVTATPLAVETGKNPPVVTKKKKSKALPIVLGLLAVLLVVGFFVYQNLPSVKFDKAMTAGEEAYNNADYETAASQFRNALTIRPEDDVAQTDLFYCYDNMAMDAYDADAYSEAIGYYDEARVYCPNYEEECVDYIKALYSDWCLNTAYGGDIETAESIYTEAIQSGYDMSATRDELDVIIATAEMMKAGQDYAQKLAETIDDGSLTDIMFEYAFGADTFVDDYYAAGGEFPVVFDITGCNFGKLGFYIVDGSPAFYYGEYSGNNRDGIGRWFTSSTRSVGNYTYYEMSGDWKEDVPNGEAIEHFRSYNSSTLTEWYIYSTVENGLYEGTLKYDYVDDDVYIGTFHNGYPEVIDTVDPNGNTSNVIAYNESKDAWIYRSDEGLTKQSGIYGFN